MLPSELPERAAVREVYEETGLRVSGLHFQGVLNFYLGESKQLDQMVFLFVCRKFTGKMRQSNEGQLRWFSVDAIPYQEMWEDDQVWLPLLLNRKSFLGDFYFSENYEKLLSHEIYERVPNVTHRESSDLVKQ